MHSRKRHRLITVFFALCSLLFMQLAVAGYVCPVDVKAVAAAESAMPCAGEMVVDAEQAALCHAHCESGQQSIKKAQAHSPIGVVAIGLAYPVEMAEVGSSIPQGYIPSQLRSNDPPMAVRNCCFRI